MSEESIFINRELSWLDFNRRVLVLGKDKNVPLAEQLKFLAIYGSNLDEFFMVRVGSLQERANLMRGKKEKRENKTNMTAEEQLAAIMPKTAQLQEDCDKYYAKALENLAACGYRKVDFDKLSKEDEHFWKKYFQSELFPILSPQIVDSRHPFPFLRNKEIYLGVLLHEKHTSEHTLGIVPISSQMERMHFVRKDNETCFALTEELVLHYAALIFGKENVQEKCLFRVTRNADIDVKEGMMDHDIDYREIMADLLKRRRKLAAVRLQVIPAAPQVAQLLCSRLELTHKRVFVQKSPLDLSFFYKLTSRMESDGHPELFYTPARPMLPPQDYDLAAEVEKHDVLLSYPYQSIRPFIAMLKKAAQDPDVISIKMTLYRMARESQIVQALVEAAENGKEVVAMVEQLVLNSSRKPEDVLIHRIIITVQHQNTIIVALEIVALNHTIITSVKYQIFTSVGINLIIDERKFVHFLHLASNPRRLSTQLAVLHNNIFTANQLDTIREFAYPAIDYLHIFCLFYLNTGMQIYTDNIRKHSIIGRADKVYADVLGFRAA